jgi:hypothetical protein
VPFVQRDHQVMELARPTHLAALARHQRRLRGRALDVHSGLGEVEVGGESFEDVPLGVELECERVRLVEPRNTTRVEELCEL